jgi:hypothetical protein
MSAFQQLSARAQTRKRADGTGGIQTRIFYHAVRADFAVVTDHAVFNHTAGADFDAVAQRDVTFQDNVSIYFNVAPVGQRATQIETRRIAQHNARQQQFFCLLGLVNTLQA